MRFIFYDDFCNRRLQKIINIFGKSWFPRKNILDIGSAYGDVGIEFLKLGSNVTFNEIRNDSIDEIKKNLKKYNFEPVIFQHDLNQPFTFEKKFDLMLHCSTLYLLDNWKEHLENCLSFTNYMILDSWVVPSNSELDEVVESPLFNHGSYNGKTVNFTEKTIEEFLIRKGVKFIRFDNNELTSPWIPLNDNNSFGRQIYDWTYEDFNKGLYDHPNDEKKYITFFRRFWLIIT